MIISLVNGVVNFWSFGVMHNYALTASSEKIKRLRDNLELAGNLDEEKMSRLNEMENKIDPRSVDAVPDWLATTNMLTTLIGLFFLVVSFVLK